MADVERMTPLRYRSIFISDIHLGFRGCQADYLLDFLGSTDSKRLYLVGDIVDLWAMQGSVYWPETHNAVIREVLDKARQGTEVIYVPGNHDELLRGHLGADFGNVAVRDEVVHTTASGSWSCTAIASTASCRVGVGSRSSAPAPTTISWRSTGW